ncbi:uncharacterized protein LOC131953599 [Physella acuta]|uniref:uncharacterized protein LOC131953599 n=1 Tax=Physella acuta TaxID=109671 RepID=UPI0027DC4B52|nr:uncharacterized protein LOC131953599 [Physella acuta]
MSQLHFFVIISSVILNSVIIFADSDAKKMNQNPSADQQIEFEEDSGDSATTHLGKMKYRPVENQPKCTYFYDNRSPLYEGGLVNCSWYTSKACCKRTEVTSVFSAMDPLYSASVLCRNYLNYLMCFFCSPDQYKFYTPNKKVAVCLDYCDSLYDECKTAGFNKTLIGDEYANGTAFCAAQNFEVQEGADCFKFDPNVFGHCTKMIAWPLLTVLTFQVFVKTLM